MSVDRSNFQNQNIYNLNLGEFHTDVVIVQISHENTTHWNWIPEAKIPSILYKSFMIIYMGSKSSFERIKILGEPSHLLIRMLNTNLKNEKFFLMPYFQNQKSATNFDPPNRRWGPFYHWGAPKIVVFSRKSAVYPQYECHSNTT